MRVSVHQSGTGIELRLGSRAVEMEIDGIDPPPLTDHSFAVWFALPRAMRSGEPIEVDGPIDPAVIENAGRFTRAWELWRPREFRPVRITGAGEPPQPLDSDDRDDVLLLYSGGLDSTDMMLQLGPSPRPRTVLTVQGFEYRADDDQRFGGLNAKISGFLAEMNCRQVRLRMSEKPGGYHSWGVQLAAAAFLFSGRFKRACFAADLDWVQDMIAFPWGLNHVTNRYFKGADFQLSALCEDRTRTMKAAAVLDHPSALAALSICKRPEVRPHNCGQCSKCIRTKAIFAVHRSVMPDIFIDPAFGDAEMNQIDLTDKNERAFFVDMVQTARELDRLDSVPGLRRRYEQEILGESAPSG